MNLRDYLHFEKMTLVKFCKEVDMSPTHLGGYINKRIRLSKKTARLIERATNGKVTAEQILKDNPPKNIYTKNKN